MLSLAYYGHRVGVPVIRTVVLDTLETVYEDGVLRPIKPIKGIKEHSKVRITIEAEKRAEHLLAECIDSLPDEEAREMRRIVEEEFEKTDLRR